MNIRDEENETIEMHADHKMILLYLISIVLLLFVVCIYQKFQLEEYGFETEEYRELKAICVESIEEGIGCEIKIGPYIEYKNIAYQNEDNES